MSASRGLALWRLARAAHRVAPAYRAAASVAKPNCHIQRVLPRPTQTTAYLGRRQLSSQSSSGSSEDSPGSGSATHSEQDSDVVNHDSEVTAGTDDPKMTSDDPNMTSDSESEVTSDSEASSDEDGTRTAVLEAALLHVPSLGWTVAALEEGVKDLGLTEAAQDLFSRGAGELIDHFEVTSNSDLVDYLKKTIEHENVKGSELMMDAVEQRLRMIIPYINRWPQAMALKTFPSNALTALENLALMVDDIWYYAGDRSTDFSWYTKRTILAALYSSTEVFMLQDSSVDFHDTWCFLQRRMKDANTFAKTSKEGIVSGGAGMMSAGLTATLNMFGLRR